MAFNILITNVKEKGARVVVFNATFNNISVISWQSVLLVNKTDCHDITEILLKVALDTITLTTDLPQVTDKPLTIPLRISIRGI
jgi:hypothetical protein